MKLGRTQVGIAICYLAYIAAIEFYQLPIPAEIKSPQKLIAHAGGAINNLKYTNSAEAIEKSVLNGFQLIEVDLQVTTDGTLFGMHEWKDITSSPKNFTPNKKEITRDYLKKIKIKGEYRIATSEFLKKILEENPSLILITDKTNEFEKITNQIQNGDRVIVETFNFFDYFRAQFAGIRRPAMAISEGRFGYALEFLKLFFLHPKYITIHSAEAIKYIQVLKIAKNLLGTTALIYSSNNSATINYFQQELGAFVYTDYCHPRGGGCSSTQETY